MQFYNSSSNSISVAAASTVLQAVVVTICYCRLVARGSSALALQQITLRILIADQYGHVKIWPPPNVPLPTGIPAPPNAWFLGSLSVHILRHLDRYSRFSTVHGHHRHTHGHTDRPLTSGHTSACQRLSTVDILNLICNGTACSDVATHYH